MQWEQFSKPEEREQEELEILQINGKNQLTEDMVLL